MTSTSNSTAPLHDWTVTNVEGGVLWVEAVTAADAMAVRLTRLRQAMKRRGIRGIRRLAVLEKETPDRAEHEAADCRLCRSLAGHGIRVPVSDLYPE